MAWNMTEKGRENATESQNTLSAPLVSFGGYRVSPRFHLVHPVNSVQSRGQKIRVNQACSNQIRVDQAILKHFFYAKINGNRGLPGLCAQTNPVKASPSGSNRYF
jgi:hypothetical protein